jgi:ornithine carbamoyltransferase
VKKDFLAVRDLTGDEIRELLVLARDLKAWVKKGEPQPVLAGKTIALIFEKPSLRTRVTFETGMTQLGGHAIHLAPADIRLGQREPVPDAARNLSRWVDGIVARTFSHRTVVALAEHASIPVINALTDLQHPCQILADLLTLEEKRGTLRGLRLAYIGDGNNVCHSLVEGAARTGLRLVVACPRGYEPDAEILRAARAEAARSGATIEIGHEPAAAARDADALYTDVWASMGQEAEQAERAKAFRGFQVNAVLVGQAKPDVLVMHCLPAHRGEEITDEVMDGPHSVVFDQAENRLHAQKAILVKLLGPKA